MEMAQQQTSKSKTSQTVVMKFGGTSVGSVERIQNVADRVSKYVKETGNRVVLVVSAMSGETDRLINLAKSTAGDNYSKREYHQLVASGEQVSSALTAMALQNLGTPARSLLAHQLGISTKNVFGQDLIDHIDSGRLRSMLDEGVVPVVAGFQGVSDDGDITTLGRGGSDATAVALAAALDGARCVIFTDVDGVYSAQPSICQNAQKLKAISYDEMLELASAGAKVLQARSVRLARRYKVPLVVASSFSESDFAELDGTEIIEEYAGMENTVVSGVTCSTNEARLTLRNIPDSPGVAAKIFECVGKAGVVVDMIVQVQGEGETTTLSFSVLREDLKNAINALRDMIEVQFPKATLEIDEEMSKVSVVGEGMKTHAGVAAQMFEVLGREGINIDMITTSEIKISVAVKRKYAELAVRALHEYFIEKNF